MVTEAEVEDLIRQVTIQQLVEPFPDEGWEDREPSHAAVSVLQSRDLYRRKTADPLK